LVFARRGARFRVECAAIRRYKARLLRLLAAGWIGVTKLALRGQRRPRQTEINKFCWFSAAAGQHLVRSSSARVSRAALREILSAVGCALAQPAKMSGRALPG